MTADSVVVEGSVLFLHVLCFLFDAFFTMFVWDSMVVASVLFFICTVFFLFDSCFLVVLLLDSVTGVQEKVLFFNHCDHKHMHQILQ